MLHLDFATASTAANLTLAGALVALAVAVAIRTHLNRRRRADQPQPLATQHARLLDREAFEYLTDPANQPDPYVTAELHYDYDPYANDATQILNRVWADERPVEVPVVVPVGADDTVVLTEAVTAYIPRHSASPRHQKAARR